MGNYFSAINSISDEFADDLRALYRSEIGFNRAINVNRLMLLDLNHDGIDDQLVNYWLRYDGVVNDDTSNSWLVAFQEGKMVIIMRQLRRSLASANA